MPAVGSSSSSTAGIGGQRPGDLQPALVAVGQVAGQLVVDTGAGRRTPAARGRAAGPPPRRAGRRGPWNSEASGPCFIRTCRPTSTFSSTVMLGNSRMFWNVRATPAMVTSRRVAGRRLAPAAAPARRRGVQPGEAVEERGLAGAVRADQADDLAFFKLQRHVLQRREATEDHRDVARLAGTGVRRPPPSAGSLGAGSVCPLALVGGVDTSRRPRPPARPGGCRSGTRPCGRNRMIRISARPNMQQPVVGELAQLLRQHEQQRRAEHGARDGAHATEDDRGEQRDRLQELEALVGHRAGLVREDRAGETRPAWRR